MNTFKKFVVLVFVLPLLLLLLLVLNLYIYDPVQLFHKPYLRKTTFFYDMRIATKGIVRFYEFDSYILGTSMLENTSAKEAKEKLGGRWINISLMGSSPYVRSFVLKYIFKHQTPKQIIYSLDYIVDTDLNTNKLPTYLYDDTDIDDWRFYINTRFVLCSLIWSSAKHCVGISDGEDSVVSWIQSETPQLQGFGGIENWLSSINTKQMKADMRLIAKYQKGTEQKQTVNKTLNANIQNYIHDNILNFIEQNPDTDFHLILPTYSRFLNKIKQNIDNDKFTREVLSLLYLVEKTKHINNVTIYGFDDLDYADNIANYKDLAHYNIDMNSMQLDAIRDKKHILTTQNIEEYLHIVQKKIDAYDTDSIIEIIEAILQQKGIDLEKLQD